MNGVVLYKGSSLLDQNAEIAVIATFRTSNKKTGNLVQTWIIDTSAKPSDLKKPHSVCGNCPIKQQCYVVDFMAPNQVYNAYKQGKYPIYNPKKHDEHLQFRKVRLGAYGNASAAPVHIWDNLLKLSKKHTGYIHNWADASKYWQGRTMASVETLEQKQHANTLGYKTFRIVQDYSQKTDDEIICLADSKHKQCSECMMCDGKKANVVIKAHGKSAQKIAVL